MKICTGCGEAKPLTAYYVKTTAGDGRQSMCKACKIERVREYKSKNRDKVRESDRRYRVENCGEKQQRNRLYREQNLDRLRAADAEYHRSNPHVSWAATYRYRAATLDVHPVVEDFTRDDVIARYGDRCFHCGTGEFEHLDHHPVPIALGGAHTLANVKPSCESCNLSAGHVIRDQRQAGR